MSETGNRGVALRTAVLLAALASAVLAGPELAYGDAPAEVNQGSRFGPIAAEAGGAVLGGLLTALAGSVVASRIFPVEPGEHSWLESFGKVTVAMPVGAWVGCGLGTWLVGGACRSNGSLAGALVGGLVGSAVSLGCVLGTRASGDDMSDEILVPLALVAPPAGAVIGYELWPRSASGCCRWRGPEFGLAAVTGPDGARSAAFRFRAVSLWF